MRLVATLEIVALVGFSRGTWSHSVLSDAPKIKERVLELFGTKRTL